MRCAAKSRIPRWICSTARGFENVSVEQIAQTAGCSVGNIYHYFKSKDELAIQVTSHVDQTYLELEEQYLSDRNTPARDKLL